MDNRKVKKSRLHWASLPPLTLLQMLWLTLAGVMLSPAYCLVAFFQRVPGLHLRWRCLYLALKLLIFPAGPRDLRTIFLMIFFPLDSTRYFEIDFVEQRLPKGGQVNYLDVSSPRLLFTLFLASNPTQRAYLINPDKLDLEETKRLLHCAGLIQRCQLDPHVITDTRLIPETYDVISCVSVLEHIPEALEAVKKMWTLLKPGGRLLLTLPCAAEAEEQYIDCDVFGVLGRNDEGVTFWQRFYDTIWLQEHIFSVTGQPQEMIIFGETTKNVCQVSAQEKRTNRLYPFWREPYLVGQNFRFFSRLDALPGEGVIGMEFIKP